MNVQPFLIGEGWLEVLDGNDTARDIFKRHYSYRQRTGGRRTNELIIGPGEKYLLLTADGTALCAWRKERHRRDGQRGVECCIFRRETEDVRIELDEDDAEAVRVAQKAEISAALEASKMLRGAMTLAWGRWPSERLFTFVDPLGVRPTIRASRPTWGHVFYQAGWRFAGLTKKRLHVLEAVA